MREGGISEGKGINFLGLLVLALIAEAGPHNYASRFDFLLQRHVPEVAGAVGDSLLRTEQGDALLLIYKGEHTAEIGAL